MRKTCFIAIALTAVTLLAAGCGNNKALTESNTSSATEFATLDPSAALKVPAENPIQGTVEPGSDNGDCPQPETTITFTINGIEVCVPSYAYSQSVTVNNGIPFFTADEITTTSFEHYSDLDSLGRCQTAMACLSRETQPAEGEQRGEIGKIKPTGWHTVKYDCIPDRYLWNICKEHCMFILHLA